MQNVEKLSPALCNARQANRPPLRFLSFYGSGAEKASCWDGSNESLEKANAAL